jgi:hypothetical protein
MIEAKQAPEQILEELYIRAFGRRPTADELAKLKPKIDTEPNKQLILEDIFWALLNSQEFFFNH